MQKNKSAAQWFLAVSCAVCLLGLRAAGEGLTLFQDGATTARIVREASVEPCVTNAVTELARALKLISGATFTVVADGAPQAGDIFVGVDANLPAPGNEQVVNRLTDGILHLVGNEPRAALHAVYSFLQRELGVRWIWPGDDGEFMPARASYTVPADLNWSHVPTIKYRGFHCCGDWYDRANFLVWMSRNCATIHRHGFNKAERKYGFYNMYSTHNANLSGDTALFEAHPEYYAEVAGKRIKANICFSSDGAVDAVITQIVNTVEYYRTKAVPLDVLSIFPADNQDYCQCALCSQKSVSTGWFTFYNKIVAKMRPLYPEMKFATIAYQGYRDVPDCAIPDTEFVEYATHGRCHVHEYGDATCPNNVTDSARLSAWDDFDVPVGLYNYEYDVFSSHGVYAPFFNIVNDIVDEAARRGHVVVIPEVGMSPRYGPAVEVNSIRNRLSQYLYVRKMWDASITEDEWMADTTAMAYGPAATAMTGYFKSMEAAWTNCNRHIAILANAANYVTSILTSNAQETAEAYLSEAETVAAECDTADAGRYQANVARERILFSQWVSLRDEAKGCATILRAPRLANTNGIPAGVATGYTLADTNGTASSVSVRAAWAGAEAGRSGNPQQVLVEFLGVPDAGETLDADYKATFVSPGTDGSYSFTVAKDGSPTAIHTSGTGVDAAFTEAWAVQRVGTVLRLTVPVGAFDEPPIVGSTWYLRFERIVSAEDTASFPSMANGSVSCIFMNRDAADRPLLYYYGRPEHLGNPDTLRLAASESGFAMTIATNLTELSARDAATRAFWMRMPANTASYPEDFHRDLTNAVAQGGVAVMTSYWKMPLATLFADSTLACSPSSPDSSSISTRLATYVSDDPAFCTPNDLATKQQSAITPAYSILPEDESRWTVLCRAKGRAGTYGDKDHPYLMYRRIGKGFLVVGSETVSTDFYSLMENFLARSVELCKTEIYPGEDVTTRIAEARAEWVADGLPKTLTVMTGVYTITNEIYIDFPLTLAGETGNPADVTIQGNKTFRILTINHAGAEVKDLTIAKGYNDASWKSLYAWGNAGVRICRPSTLDRSDRNWHGCTTGAGGKLTNCIVTDCLTVCQHGWGIVYLDGPKDKTLVDRCIITNNAHSAQNNSRKGKGDIVTVVSGIFRNSLVARNASNNLNVNDTDRTTYQGLVAVVGNNGVIVGCTIAGNVTQGNGKSADAKMRIGGVYAPKGKVINTVIAGNTCCNYLEASHQAWGGAASSFVSCITDTAAPINDTCLTGDPLFLRSAKDDWRIVQESPCCNAGTNDTAWTYGDADLAGNPRTRTVGGETKIDLGAYQCDPEARYAEASCVLPSGVHYDNIAVGLSVDQGGFGLSPTYYWDFNGDGVTDRITDQASLTHNFGIGDWTLSVIVSNVAENVGRLVEVPGGAFEVVAHAIHYVDANSTNPEPPYLTPETAAMTLEEAVSAAKEYYDALSAEAKHPSDIVLLPGTHEVAREVQLTWPMTIRGSTGKAGDVIVDLGYRDKAFCLNDAKALLSSLTVYRGTCTGINSYGVVRLCKPNGRGNQTNSTADWGNGGVVSNVVLCSCSSTDKLTGRLFQLRAGSGVITHCVVTNCTAWQQQDGLSMNGMFLHIEGGRADNCLIAKNTLTSSSSGTLGSNISSPVAVSGGSFVNSTVANNKASGGGVNLYCSGVHATGGKVVNVLVANNTTGASRAHFSTWAGTGSCFVSCFMDCDEADIPNETCLAGDPKFLAPNSGMWNIVKESPCRDVGTNSTTWVYGDTDLAGNPRTRTVGETTTIDIGAYQYDKSMVAAFPACTLQDDLLYDNVAANFLVEQGGFGTSPVYYWDFNGDGKTDFTTRDSSFTRNFGLGTWDVRVTVSNLEDNVGLTQSVAGGQFTITPHPVHYVDINGKNPVSPYLTPANAATNIQDAIDVAASGDEVRISDGTYPVAVELTVTTDRIRIGAASGKPESVIVRATSGRNRCLMVHAGARTIVHSMTFENGRGGSGAAITSSKCREYAGNVCIGYLTQNAVGDVTLAGTGSGILSNCVVRGGIAGNKFSAVGGVLAYGPNAFVTHCVISNNTSSGGYTDNGMFGATGLSLGNGARAEHCLVTRNYSGGNKYYQCAVHVADKSVLRYSTVTKNTCALVGGVNVSGSGRFEKCVIAGNALSTSDTTDPRHAVWGAFNYGIGDTYYRIQTTDYRPGHLTAEETRHTNEVIQTYVCTNATDIADADLGAGSLKVDQALLFKNPSRGDYTPRRLSPTVNRVPFAAETTPMPATDIRGRKRGCDGGYDLGAFERQNSGSMLLVR